MPLPRLNEEFAPGAASLFRVSVTRVLLGGSLSLSAFDDTFSAAGAGFSGAGGGKISSSFNCRLFLPRGAGEEGVGQLGVCHHLEQVVIRQPVRPGTGQSL